MADGEHTPRVLVDDRQDEAIDLEPLVAVARETITGEGVAAAELSLSFVTEAEIAGLHETYMDEPGPTDVLSFQQDEEAGPDGVRLLGDVIVCPAVAAQQNPGDPAAELRLLVVHGVLHLLGYDHREDAERAEMWARQERYSGVAVREVAP